MENKRLHFIALMIKFCNDYIFLNHFYHQQVSNKQSVLDDKDLSFLNPDRPQMNQYQLVLWSDNKLCPKSVRRCEQCKKPFVETSDKFVLKTFGMQEVTEKCGTIKKYTGNIYLHYIRKSLYNWDSGFCFGAVNVPERTKEKTPATWRTELKRHGIKFT